LNEEDTMPLSHRRWSLERITGFVMVAIFAAGLLGATLAIVINHGELPSHIAAKAVETVKEAAPL
jgi:hypothetical protein